MTNFIPIFPLAIVVFPREELNLHIFEARYIQLIKECFATNKMFGICSVIDNNISEVGTLVKVKEITKLYDNGAMDIKTQGLEVFKILELIKELPDKLYSGAIVTYPLNIITGSQSMMKVIIAAIRELHKLLNIHKNFTKFEEELWSYEVAHHAALSLTEEYELLQLLHELQRQEYLKRHLKKVMPVIAAMEDLKEKVQLNGHFKNISGFEIK